MTAKAAKAAALGTATQLDSDIVVSGMAGRLPESDSILEFIDQLYAGKDLVTEDDRRWPVGVMGLPPRSGKLKDLSRFDAQFFGVHARQAQAMDLQLRMLLEVTHEAIIDAGYNPAELRGSRTGVFVGASKSETEWSRSPERTDGYELAGCYLCMFANRISFAFDLHGPSLSLDTGCSSSGYALHQAAAALRAGECDAALVAGSNLCLHPTMALRFKRFQLTGQDGTCRSFDEAGSGIARSESVVVALLQRRRDARRVYASVLGTGCNADGNKEAGIAHPSGPAQVDLAKRVCALAGVDPREVSYVEAHAAGTKAGDRQEGFSIAEVYCKEGRRDPVLVGSVKSNMGHAEPAAGMASIVKVLASMERGELPANLHFNRPNADIPALFDGRLKVVDKNLPWSGPVAAVNSVGFGGTNSVALIRSNPKKKVPRSTEITPRLIAVSGRTQKAVEHMLKEADRQRDDELHAMLATIHRLAVPGHTYRGYAVLGAAGVQEVQSCSGDPRPVWFVFSGLGCQWPSMARHMMRHEPFVKSINTSACALRPYGLDLKHLLTDAEDVESDQNTSVCIAAVQMALVDSLRALGVKPDGFIGYSIGELACAYADGALTAEQTVLAAYSVDCAVRASDLPPGTMVTVDLSREKVESRCPPDVYVSCHNSVESVTVSGPPEPVSRMVKELEAEGVFVWEVAGSKYAMHSPNVLSFAPKLRAALERYLPEPRARSPAWISSSVPEQDWGSPQAQLCSAEYFAKNIVGPVLFAEAMEKIPDNAIVVDLSPHHLLRAIVKRAKGPSVTYVDLMEKNHPDNLLYFLAGIGKLYNAGAQPQTGQLLPPVQFPVSRGTPMIAPMVKWDHSTKWEVADFSGHAKRSGGEVYELDVSKDSDKYLIGHTVGGHVLFPASGYLVCVWKTFAELRNRSMEDVPVVMENLKFSRATLLRPDGGVRIHVSIAEGSGFFEVREGDEVIATGWVRTPEESDLTVQHIEPTRPVSEPGAPEGSDLTSAEVYRELRLRGYEYSGAFRGVLDCDNQGRQGRLRWDGNWVIFMDLMLHFSLICDPDRELRFLTGLRRVVLDPKRHAKAVLGMQEDGVVVTMWREANVLRSGGVEIRGVKTGTSQRQQSGRDDAKLERYVFVPYLNSQPLDSDSGRDVALAVLLQIVAENLDSPNLKIAELLDTQPPETLLLPHLLQAMENEPKLQADATVKSATLEALPAELQDLDVKLSGATDSTNPVNILLAGKSIARDWKRLAASVKPRGFVLLEEKDGNAVAPVGLELVSQQRAGAESCFLLLRKLDEIDEKPEVISFSNERFDWLEPLRAVVQGGEKAVLVSREAYSGLLGMVQCLRKEPGGEGVGAVLIQDPKAVPFSLDTPFYAKQVAKGLRASVLRPGGVWGSYRHLPFKGDTAGRSVEHAYLTAMQRGDLSSLRWVQGPNSHSAQHCTVHYAALNFKDVMLATGKLSRDSLIIPRDLELGPDAILGFEFSGRDSSGRRVMGFVAGRALATSVLPDPEFLWEVPESWTLEEAATVPVCYATSYYTLVQRAGLQGGESVLIHCGAGGVGLAAITLALQLGCSVYTTVSSAEKRAFLLRTFPQLSEARIAYSRDCSFELHILAETGGRGVDVVLNSLGGEQLLASARCVAQGGHFIDIGRLDMQADSPLGMGLFLRNATFHGIQVDALFGEAPAYTKEKRELARLVQEGLRSGAVRPLPSKAFQQQQAEEAFRFLASGQQIGKVLVRIREDQTVDVPTSVTAALPRTYLDPAKAYVVVGGLGGLGLELCGWLVDRGARRLVLSSRSAAQPRSGFQVRALRGWQKKGVQVLVTPAGSCGSEKGARSLLSEAKTQLGSVGGIFNLAVELRDALLENQTEEDFVAVCRPKLQLTVALDVASRALCPELEYFVCFSSVICGRGGPGQTNYGLGNSATERLCEARQADGLPGLAIQWGLVGDVGQVADISNLEVEGTLPQRISSCLAVLDEFLQQHTEQPVLASTVLAAKRTKAQQANTTPLEAVAKILGLKDVQNISSVQTLADLGMDSLTSTEIKQVLERHHDMALSPREIRGLSLAQLMRGV